MPASLYAERRVVQVPYSEAAMCARIAGLNLPAVEEDLYVNGSEIPAPRRYGCYVETQHGSVPLLKSEAGWQS